MTANEKLVARVSPVATASIWYDPTLSSLRALNVATPATAATVTVPDSVPLTVLVNKSTDTLVVAAVTRLLLASSTSTTTPGAMATPEATSDGWVMNLRWVAMPGVTVIAELVTLASPDAAAVRVYVPARSKKIGNAAIPVDAATLALVVPSKTLPAGLAPSDSVTAAVDVGTALPSESVTPTPICTLARETAAVGRAVKTSLLPAPGVTVNSGDVALASPG